jgi:predicted nucleotidyltransferase
MTPGSICCKKKCSEKWSPSSLPSQVIGTVVCRKYRQSILDQDGISHLDQACSRPKTNLGLMLHIEIRSQKVVRVKQTIIRCIHEIEDEEQVKAFYACESGSRAWGFPSTDSDYDVRFIYLHPRDWYLSVDLEQKRDVIERPIDNMLDINGWDLRKALKLLRKGNPPLMEWLGSPIVYREQFTVAEQMRDLMARYYSPIASLYHYFRMAEGNYRSYLKGPEVWIKKYFYVLRPLLAIRWIERDLGIVPMEFSVLVDKVVDSPAIKGEIQKLIESKRRGEELDQGPRIVAISDFVEAEMARLDRVQIEAQYSFNKSAGPSDEFSRVFRSALDEVWQPTGAGR